MACRYFFKNTALGIYESLMQCVPGFSRDRDDSLSYMELVNDIIYELNLHKARPRLYKVMKIKEERELLFKNEKHKARFKQYEKLVKKYALETMNSNNRIAVIYLLSSNENLWNEFLKSKFENEINLKKIKVQNSDEETYDVYQTARFLHDGTAQLTMEDLIEPEIIKDYIVRLIMAAFIINKYGMPALATGTLDSALLRRTSKC